MCVLVAHNKNNILLLLYQGKADIYLFLPLSI